MYLSAFVRFPHSSPNLNMLKGRWESYIAGEKAEAWKHHVACAEDTRIGTLSPLLMSAPFYHASCSYVRYNQTLPLPVLVRLVPLQNKMD